ncbi:MAG: transcriptional repressor [Deltaproteobacteria bacterium]|nr:transcriptional repressor [Deltaproteobacteria bacterium]
MAGIERCDPSRTLKKAGLAKTAQRMAVLEKLIGAEAPLSVRHILEEAGKAVKINRVTVYRILTSFKKEGIVREVEAGQGSVYYEMACLHNPIHPHFNCRRCGCLLCMPPLTLSQAWDWFARPNDFTIEAVNVHITGICNHCRDTDKRNPVASKRKEKTP